MLNICQSCRAWICWIYVLCCRICSICLEAVGCWICSDSGFFSLPVFFCLTPLPRQCKGGLPVHRSGMPLSALEGPGSLKILLSPNLPPGNSTLDRWTQGGNDFLTLWKKSQTFFLKYDLEIRPLRLTPESLQTEKRGNLCLARNRQLAVLFWTFN